MTIAASLPPRGKLPRRICRNPNHVGVSAGESLSIALPMPPSVNAIWRTGKGGRHYKSKPYVEWIRQCDFICMDAKYRRRFEPVRGPFTAAITLDRSKRRGDADNRIKPILDWLQRADLIDNDSLCEKVSAEWGEAPLGCRVVVSSFEVTP